MRNMRQSGFTLVELLVVVIVIAILAAIAYPSFIEQIRAARRTNAMEKLEELGQYQAKWRANQTTYASNANFTATAGYPNYPLTGEYYVITITANSASGFTATATPKAGTDQVNDDCGTFSLNQSGPNYSGYANADCWKR